MTDNNQKQEEQEERKPYQNSYRNTVAKDDPIDEVESEETEEAITEANATSFVESKKDSKPKHNYKKRYDDLKKHYDEKIDEFKKYKEEHSAEWGAILGGTDFDIIEEKDQMEESNHFDQEPD